MLYNLLASILRALGDSKVPLYFLILSAFLNIVLDLAFVIVFRMGAAGAAVATIISQGISGLLCLLYIARKVPVLAMGTTMATYGAQNMGAGDVPRIRQGFKACTIIGVIYSLIAAALVMTVGKYMTYLFVSDDVELIMDSVDIYLKCVGLFFIPLTIVNVYRNGIQGLGYGLLPMTAGIAELIGRGMVALIAAQQRSYLGVCLASPAAWVLAGALLIAMYYYIMNHDMKEIFRGTSGNIDKK